MFLDFQSDGEGVPRSTDICVIGAGVMGLAVASQVMASSRRRLLLIEEGGLQDTPEASAVPAELSGGDLASGVAQSRARGFGGSSRRWGGQALPFTPLDLEDRACTACRGGWPISWADLQPHYRAADRFLGLSALPFDSDLWHCPRLRSAFGEQAGLALSLSKYSPHAYLDRVHQGRIGRSRQADCLLHAKVAWIEAAAEPGAPHRISIRNRSGREATLEARVVVLCAGGIENARILLSSQRHGNLRLGDGADAVGRYYQDHVGFFAAQLEPADWPTFRHLFSSFIPGDQKYVPKLQLSQQLQREQGLLNVTGNLDVQEADDSPRNAARRLYSRLRRRRTGNVSLRPALDDLGRLLAAAPESAGLLHSHLLERRIALPRRARFFLMANAESEPLADSRILLSDQRDRWLRSGAADRELARERGELPGASGLRPGAADHPGEQWHREGEAQPLSHRSRRRLARTGLQPLPPHGCYADGAPPSRWGGGCLRTSAWRGWHLCDRNLRAAHGQRFESELHGYRPRLAQHRSAAAGHLRPQPPPACPGS